MSVSSNYKDIEYSSPKSFGVVFSIFFLVIALYPLFNSKSIHIWALILSAIFLFLAYVAPRSLNLLNKIWFKFGIFLGSIIAPIVMVLIYFLTVLPTGLIMRLFNKDLLNQKFEKNNNSYWINRSEKMNSMKKQF